MRIRSMVGLIPLYACSILDDDVIEKLPMFKQKLEWFKKNRDDLSQEVCLHILLIVNSNCVFLAYFKFVEDFY